MKSLVLKDLYNIGHNIKSTIFILLMFRILFISSDVLTYVLVCNMLCIMMIFTTFSFDETSKWVRYALVMPVSRKDVVLGKFITLAIFSVIGTLFGIILGSLGGFLTHNLSFNPQEIGMLLIHSFAACGFSLICGSISIPLMFKFGSEKGRILITLALLIPLAIGYGAYQLLAVLGIQFTNKFMILLLCCAPLFVLIWVRLMYRISYRIFLNQEF